MEAITKRFPISLGVAACLSAVLFLTVCAGSASSADGRGAASAGSRALQLDDAISQAAGLIGQRVAAGTKIALLNFKSPSDRFSEYFINELEAGLLDNGKLTVIDRKEIDLIRGEMAFQMSGEVSDESIQMAGQKLGAQSIVSGQLMEIGDTYRMVVRVLNVETAAVAAQYRNDVRNDDRVRALLTDRKKTPDAQRAQAPTNYGANRTPAPEPNPAVAANAAAPATNSLENKAPPVSDPNKTYKIGDTGPAGGLIFYDKGNNSGGWRYMEAAPVSAEKKFKWWEKRYLKDIPRTKDHSVGKGKENTQELMEYVNENCGIYNTELPAIHYCSTLDINGYKDWFLPNVGELSLMCHNLHIRGLGKFSNDFYWSSNTWDHFFSYGLNFNDNKSRDISLSSAYLVRPARRF